MRARNIKPGFFKNETLADKTHAARLLYIALWCLADREGFIEYRPKRIKAEAFPYEQNINVDELLEELCNFMECISYKEKTFLKIKAFKKNQSPHKNEKPSEIKSLSDCQVITCNFTELPYESGLRTEDIRTDNPLQEDKPLAGDGNKSIYPEPFLMFWNAYPKKKQKGGAFKAWLKIKNTPSVDEVVAAVEAQKKTHDWLKSKGQFIPYPATWINGRGWEDEVSDKPQSSLAGTRYDFTP